MAGRVNYSKWQIHNTPILNVEGVHLSIHPPPYHSFTLLHLIMPYISTEALVGAGLLVVLAVGYQYMPTGAASGSANAKKNKKNKKKSKGAATPNEPQLTSVPLPPGPPSGQAKPAENGLKPETSANEPQLERPPAGSEPPTQPAQPVQPAAPKPKTLAEKIAPQPRKTKVDE